MLVQYAGSWVTNDGSGTFSERAITSAQGFKVNGKQLVQIAQFLRGLSEIPIARGNKINVITFAVTRNFALLNPSDTNPIGSAEAFALTHFTSLPQSGLLKLFPGPIGGSPSLLVTAQNAVLEATPSVDITGIRLTINYSIQCSSLVAAPPSGTVLQSGAGGTLTSATGGSLTSA